MPAAEYDLFIEQGANYRQVFRWKDSNDDPIDLTSYSARMHIRRTIDSKEPVLELTTDNGRITLGGVQGTITLELTADETEGIQVTAGVYDLELIAPDDFVTRILKGSVTIDREVTRNGNS